MSLPDSVAWWREYRDKDAGRDPGSVRIMRDFARGWLTDQERIRSTLTPKQIVASGWDDIFAEDVATVTRNADELSARLDELTDPTARLERRQRARFMFAAATPYGPGDWRPGELLTMGDGSQWFHRYGGGAPVKITDATRGALSVDNA